MKKIYPNTLEDRAQLTPESEKPVTQQQYEDLVRRTNEAEAAAASANSNTNSLRNAIASGITTNTVETSNISSDVGEIGELTSTNINSTLVSSNTVCASLRIETPFIHADEANACRFTGDEVDVCSVKSDSICSCTGTINDLTVEDITVNGSMALDNLSVDTSSVDNLSADAAVIDCATVDSATIECATIDDAAVTNATATNATITSLSATNADINYVTHIGDPQVLTGSAEYYIVLPLFTNGTYVIEGQNDTQKKLFSIEFMNSLDNLMFRWSFPDGLRFLDVKYKTAENGVLNVQVHVQSFGEEITLYRKSDSTDNLLPPTIYTTDQFIDEKVVYITDKQGTYIAHLIFTDKLKTNCLEIDNLQMPEITVYNKIWLTCGLDDQLQCEVSTGEEYQYIANTKDADGLNIRPSWNTPVSCAVNGVINRGGTCLVNENALSEYNGKVQGEDVLEAIVLEEADILAEWTELEPNYKYAAPDDTYYDSEGTAIAYALYIDGVGLEFYDEGDNKLEIEGEYTLYQYVTGSPYYPIRHLNSNTCVEGSDGLITSCNVVSQTNTTECECISCKLILDNTVAVQNNGSTNAKLTNSVAVSAQGITCDDFSIVKSGCRYGLGCNDYGDTISCTCLEKMPVTLNASNVASPSKNIYVECDTETQTLHVTCDACICGSIAVDCNAVICGNTNIGCELVVGCDTHIRGDLYVEGKTYTKESETISTGSDTIVLRQNNPSGMAATEFSGMIVHNYDGHDNNIMLGTDSTGTARVGTKAGIDTTYAVILYKDGVWYDATEQELNPQPTGELTSYDSKEVVGNFTKYTNAVFTELDVTGLEALMTRAEEANMVDGALVCWNASCIEAQTLTPPAEGGSILSYNPATCANFYKAAGNNGEVLTTCVEVDPVTTCVTKSLVWSCVPRNYHFESMACYLAVCSIIPTDSLVIIDEYNDYVQSEDVQ